MNLIKRVLAGGLYIGGILFAIYIANTMLKGNSIFDMSGLIRCTMCVCIPVAIGTFLFISSMQEVNKRFRIMKVFVLFLFVFYTMLLVHLLFRNGMRSYGYLRTISIEEGTNFIPFKTIGVYIRSYTDGRLSRTIVYENLLGNIILFAPMGILLPCIFQSLSKFRKFLMVTLIILISVEIGQWLTRSGSCDIDDIILNLIGAVVFYGLWNLNITQKILRRMYVLK